MLPVKSETLIGKRCQYDCDAIEPCVSPVKPDTNSAIGLYAPRDSEKVAMLWDMGFTDEDAARHALQANNGDVQDAISWLLQGTPPTATRRNLVTS